MLRPSRLKRLRYGKSDRPSRLDKVRFNKYDEQNEFDKHRGMGMDMTWNKNWDKLRD